MSTAVLRETRTFTALTPFREATFDTRTETAEVVIISEGLGNLRDKNYYTKEAIASAAEVFNGKQFFLDHPTETEDRDRPERSVRDLGGFFYQTRVGMIKDPDTGEPLHACFARLRFDNSSAGRDAKEKVRTAIEHARMFPRSKDVYAGISINGGGVSEPDTINNLQVNKVTRIQEAFSADVVTKPARGGRFLSLIQEAERLSAWKSAQVKRHGGARMGKEAGGGTAVVIPPAKGKLIPPTYRGKTKEAAKPAGPTNDPKDPISRAHWALREAVAKKLDTLLEQMNTGLSLQKPSMGISAPGNPGSGETEGEGEGLERAGMTMPTLTDEAVNALADRVKQLKDAGGASNLKALASDLKGDIEQLLSELADGEGVNEPLVKDIQGDLADLADQHAGPAGAGDAMGPDTSPADMPPEKEEPEAEHDMLAPDDGELGMGDGLDIGGEEPYEEEPYEREGLEGMEHGAPGAGAGPQHLAFKCTNCETENTVGMPEGYRLAKTTESTKTGKRREAAVAEYVERRLLQEGLSGGRPRKEGGRMNGSGTTKPVARTKEAERPSADEQVVRQLREENLRLRRETIEKDAELEGYRRLDEAVAALREAKVPPSILRPEQLIMLDPEVWDFHIGVAKRSFAHETRLNETGGMPARGGGHALPNGKVETKPGETAIAKFTESFQSKAAARN